MLLLWVCVVCCFFVSVAVRKGATFAARRLHRFGWHCKRNREEEPVLTSCQMAHLWPRNWYPFSPLPTSDGAGSATSQKARGLTRSVIALMVPPLPAASRPSKITITRSPLSFTHSCRRQSSSLQLAQLLFVLLGLHLGLGFVHVDLLHGYASRPVLPDDRHWCNPLVIATTLFNPWSRHCDAFLQERARMTKDHG